MIDVYNMCQQTDFMLRGIYLCSQILFEDFTTIYNDLQQYIIQGLDITDPIQNDLANLYQQNLTDAYNNEDKSDFILNYVYYYNEVYKQDLYN